MHPKMTWEAFSLHSSYSTTLTFHICSHKVYFAVLVFDLIPFKRDYLSALNDFKRGFFRRVVRNQTPRAYIRVTFCLRTDSILPPFLYLDPLSILHPFSTLTYGQPFVNKSGGSVKTFFSLSNYFHISGIVSIFKDYAYLPQQKFYLSTVSGPCITRTDLVSIYLPICSVAVHY